MQNSEEQYEYIDSLVGEYQKGSSTAPSELLSLFGYHTDEEQMSGFIGKYYKLLRHGVIIFRDRDTRSFIRLFTSDTATRKALIPSYQYSDTKKAARKTVQMINDRLNALSDDELLTELSISLLEMAKRYKKIGRKVNFCGYLYNSYRYQVFESFSYLFKDLLYNPYIEALDDYADEHAEFDIPDFHEDLYFEKETQELGFNWILGRTATYPFDQLSIFERTILSLHEVKGYTYEEIGEQMGYHRDTVWNKRKQIKIKLIELTKNPPMY